MVPVWSNNSQLISDVRFQEPVIMFSEEWLKMEDVREKVNQQKEEEQLQYNGLTT